MLTGLKCDFVSKKSLRFQPFVFTSNSYTLMSGHLTLGPTCKGTPLSNEGA